MIRTRDDKIAALKRDCQTLEWAAAEEGALRMAVESNNATLRQKLAEAEGRAAKWVPAVEFNAHHEAGWWSAYGAHRVADGDALYLMVPPVPLPEGE